MYLTAEQTARQSEFRAFAREHIEPAASEWDRNQEIPHSAIAALAERGYLGCNLPSEHGGHGWDMVTFGLLVEALGRSSSSVSVILTVQAMVSNALLKWGTADQKEKWLRALATGKVLGAFALTEPNAGSATSSLTTEFTQDPASDNLILNGAKKWISCAQMAGVFLVFGNLQQQTLACLVRRETPGLRIEPTNDMVGFRAGGLAEVHFDNVKVPPSDVVGKPGFALSHVASVGLHYGRISTACSGLGILRGCFEESISYASMRKAGSETIGELGMIRSLIARMGTDLEAGKLLCHNACRTADEHTPEAFEKALVAKYFTSRAAVAAASDAIQIRGASGCHGSAAVSRYYRDAKILEIIEGTTQIHEHLLGRMFVNQVSRSRQ